MSETARKAVALPGFGITERPILFSAPMVRAILEGRKTQTRRVVKPQPAGNVWQDECSREWFVSGHGEAGDCALHCPYGSPGTRLWVRETWQGPLLDEDQQQQWHEDGPELFRKPEFCAYRATDLLDGVDEDGKDLGWRPSIHMPRWASRITLEITGVRVERLQEIHSADALAEGIQNLSDEWRVSYGILGEISAQHPVRAYQLLWETINGPGSWDLNPWVWIVEFKRI